MPEEGVGLSVVVLVEESAQDAPGRDPASAGVETWEVTSSAAANREIEEGRDFPPPYLHVVPDAHGPVAGHGLPGDSDQRDPGVLATVVLSRILPTRG